MTVVAKVLLGVVHKRRPQSGERGFAKGGHFSGHVRRVVIVLQYPYG